MSYWLYYFNRKEDGDYTRPLEFFYITDDEVTHKEEDGAFIDAKLEGYELAGEYILYDATTTLPWSSLPTERRLAETGRGW